MTIRNKPLNEDEIKQIEALSDLADELSEKLTILCNGNPKSAHHEDCELDTCEYLAKRIHERIKELRGTDKLVRSPADHARSGTPALGL